MGKTEIVQAEDQSTAILLARAEVDQQISTARAFPRSVAKFKTEAMTLATLDIETASSCFYSLPRGGSNIEGPSARLAEIVASSYGNLRYGAKVVEVTQTHVVALGQCHDLEKNTATQVEVRRSIVGKRGRFNQDMITVTGNAACSIALRNAIFKVVPFALVKSVYDAARKTAIGDAATLTSRRDKMVGYFGKMGVTPERVCWAIGKPSVEDIQLDDMATLTGMATAIKEDGVSVDTLFPTSDPNAEPVPEPKEKPKSKAAAKAAAKTEPKAEDAKPAESDSKAKAEAPTKEAAPEPEKSSEGESEPAPEANETKAEQTKEDTPPDFADQPKDVDKAGPAKEEEAKAADAPPDPAKVNANSKFFVRWMGQKKIETRPRDMSDGDLDSALESAMSSLHSPDLKLGHDGYYKKAIEVLQAEKNKRGRGTTKAGDSTRNLD